MTSAVASKQEPVPVEIFLRVKHPTMDPQEMTEKLGVEPEHTANAGPAASRSGVRRLHSESYWLARLPTLTVQERISNLRSFSTKAALSAPDKEKVHRLLDATTHDLFILDALGPLMERKQFLQELSRKGSVVLLVQRTDRTVPLALRASFPVLTELGIALEID